MEHRNWFNLDFKGKTPFDSWIKYPTSFGSTTKEVPDESQENLPNADIVPVEPQTKENTEANGNSVS